MRDKAFWRLLIAFLLLSLRIMFLFDEPDRMAAHLQLITAFQFVDWKRTLRRRHQFRTLRFVAHLQYVLFLRCMCFDWCHDVDVLWNFLVFEDRQSSDWWQDWSAIRRNFLIEPAAHQVICDGAPLLLPFLVGSHGQLLLGSMDLFAFFLLLRVPCCFSTLTSFRCCAAEILGVLVVYIQLSCRIFYLGAILNHRHKLLA